MANMDELVKALVSQCKTQEDFNAFFKALKQRGLEAALSGELTEHLGYEKHQRSDGSKINARNGYTKKVITTQDGELAIAIPRDREDSFEPQLIPKYQTRFDGIDEKILSLYARGLSTHDIQAELEELYGSAVSPTM